MEPISISQYWDDLTDYGITGKYSPWRPVHRPIWEVNIDGEQKEIDEAAVNSISDYIREHGWGVDTELFVRDLVNSHKIHTTPPPPGRAFITKKTLKAAVEANRPDDSFIDDYDNIAEQFA